jgi:predicted RNA-binding Zn ribbon-like protein
MSAPGNLALVQDFVNTVDLESATDSLSDVASAHAWLVQHELWDAPRAPAEDERRTLTGFRHAIRVLLQRNHDGEASPTAVDLVNRYATAAPLLIRFDPGGAVLEAAGEGPAQVIGRLSAAMLSAMADGTWARLKICPSDSCQWAFYDTSKNRSGTWCSMAVCGNRAKVRAYQARRRASRAGPTAQETP